MCRSFSFFITLPAMLAARARAAGTAWRSGLPALTGGAARALCVPSHHIHPEMPDKWRRLSECRGATRPLSPCRALSRLTPGPRVRSLHRPRGVGHCGAQAAGEPDAGDGEVSRRPEGHCSGGEPTGAYARLPACSVAWRGETPACLHCAWRGDAGAASPVAPRAPAVHHAAVAPRPCTAGDRPAMHPAPCACTYRVPTPCTRMHRRSSRRIAPLTAIGAAAWSLTHRPPILGSARAPPLRLPRRAWRLWAARHF